MDAGSKCVHIQFRRFSGCSICNLHLQRVLKRLDEIKSAGIREVVFFHSSVDELMPFQGKFDLDVIADPEKIYYKKFGVRSSILSVLNPGAWLAMIGGVSEKERPQGGGQSGHLGLPADFMISSEGKIIEAYYGEHAADQWSVKQILEKCTP